MSAPGADWHALSRAREPSAGSKTSYTRSVRTCCQCGTPSGMPAPGAVPCNGSLITRSLMTTLRVAFLTGTQIPPCPEPCECRDRRAFVPRGSLTDRHAATATGFAACALDSHPHLPHTARARSGRIWPPGGGNPLASSAHVSPAAATMPVMRRRGDGRHTALRRVDGITVSDGDGRGERARSRRYGRRRRRAASRQRAHRSAYLGFSGGVIWSCLAGAPQARLVGEDDGLNAVTQAKLGHGVGEVSLDGGLADEQGRGDLDVR